MLTTFLCVSSVLSLAMLGETKARKDRSTGTVVFVCEHGSGKSLIAREWFNRLAGQRGLALRAASRGLTPDGSVPPAIAEALRGDGFDVAGFEARALTAPDLAGAARIVAIGIDTSSLGARADSPIDRWDDVPPASVSYAASRDALRARIEALVASLESQGHGR